MLYLSRLDNKVFLLDFYPIEDIYFNFIIITEHRWKVHESDLYFFLG